MHITLCSCVSHFTGFCQQISYALRFLQIILQDTFITSNTASISGGGLDIHVHISSEGSNDGFPLHCRVINSRIIGNTATQEGGGLYLLGFMKVGNNMMWMPSVVSLAAMQEVTSIRIMRACGS